MSFIRVEEKELIIRMPTGRFTDTVLDNWIISTDSGSLAGVGFVRKWSREQIEEWGRMTKRHLRFGRHLRPIERRLERMGRPRATALAVALEQHLAVRKPSDRSTTLANMTFGGDYPRFTTNANWDTHATSESNNVPKIIIRDGERR